MKNYKKWIFVSLALLIVGFVLYNELPKRGTFNSLILQKYSSTKFMRVMADYGSIHVSSKNTEPLGKLLSYLKDFKLVEDKHPNYISKEQYYIRTYAEDGNSLILVIENKNHIYIQTYLKDEEQKNRSYKIIGNGIDMNYVSDLLKEIKPDN